MVQGTNGKTREAGRETGDAAGISRIAQALRECEADRARIQALMHLGTWRFDPETRTGSGSDEFFRILGIARTGTLTYKDFEARMHPDDRAGFNAAVARVIEEKRKTTFEYRILRPDGTLRYLHGEGEFAVAAGRPTVNGTVQDITERKNMEQALRESEESFINTFEASPVPTVISLRRDERYIAVNRAFERGSGFSRAEVLGKTTDELGLTPERSVIPRLLKEIENGGVVFNREIVFRGKTKNKIIGLVSIIPFTFKHQDCYLFVGIDINDRKKTEEALLESEKSFINAFEASPAVTVISSMKDGRLVEVNNAFVAASGYSRSEVIGKTSEEMGIFPQFPLRGKLLREVERKGGVHNREIVFRGKEGREVIGLTSIIALTFRRQPCLLFVGIDITERKRTEEALTESKGILDSFIAYAPGIIVIMDEELRHIKVNRAAAEIIGRKPEEIEGKRYDEIMPPEMTARYEEDYRKVLKTGKPVNKEFSLSSPWNKETTHVLSFRFPIPLPGGKRGVGVFGLDITARKKAEDALRRSEFELRTLVENSPDIIFRLDRYLRYVFVNPTYERLTGIPREKFIGKTNDELAMPGQMAEFWKSAARNVVESGRERSVEFEMPGFFGTRYFSARLIPDLGRSGLVETVLVIARDITERKHAEEKIASLTK